MKKEEFIATKFNGKMIVEYQQKKYPLKSVDLAESLFAFNVAWQEDLYWARCENVKIVKE